MKQAVQTVLMIGIAAGCGTMLNVLSAAAQMSPSQPLQDLQNPDKSGDPFSSRSSNPLGNVMDLIHRSVLGPSRNLDEYTADQQESLDAAAAEFRAKQAERLHQAQPTSAVDAPVTASPVPTSGAN